MKLIKSSLAALALGLSATGAFGQVSITTLDVALVADFSSWGSAYSVNDPVTSVISGFSVSGVSASATYRGANASTTGGLYNAGGFNHQASSSANNLTLTGTWVNNTGGTINSIAISYDAFVQVDRASRIPGWAVGSSDLGDPDLTSLNWLSSDGSVTESNTINGLNIANGESFSLTWATERGAGSGSSPMVGLDNISITASAIPEPSTYAALVGFLALGVAGLRRRQRA